MAEAAIPSHGGQLSLVSNVYSALRTHLQNPMPLQPTRRPMSPPCPSTCQPLITFPPEHFSDSPTTSPTPMARPPHFHNALDTQNQPTVGPSLPPPITTFVPYPTTHHPFSDSPTTSPTQITRLAPSLPHPITNFVPYPTTHLHFSDSPTTSPTSMACLPHFHNTLAIQNPPKAGPSLSPPITTFVPCPTAHLHFSDSPTTSPLPKTCLTPLSHALAAQPPILIEIPIQTIGFPSVIPPLPLPLLSTNSQKRPTTKPTSTRKHKTGNRLGVSHPRFKRSSTTQEGPHEVLPHTTDSSQPPVEAAMQPHQPQ